MAGPVTIYVPVSAVGAGSPHAASGLARVRPVDEVRQGGNDYPAHRNTPEVAELARKAREAVDAALERRVGAEKHERPLMAGIAPAPDSGPGRAAADAVYRMVEEFGPSRWGRGFLFDVEI